MTVAKSPAHPRIGSCLGSYVSTCLSGQSLLRGRASDSRGKGAMAEACGRRSYCVPTRELP